MNSKTKTPATQKLRCRVGDIAITNSPDPGDGSKGVLVLVLRRYALGETLEDGQAFQDLPTDPPSWVVKSLGTPFQWVDKKGRPRQRWNLLTVFFDGALIPLRDDPGQDEMLRVTGKPKRKKVAA